MLEIKNLSVSLTENKKIIIKNANLSVYPGEVHILNGNNGSGKSTLVNAVMGNPELIVSKGSIKLKNETLPSFVKPKLNLASFKSNEIDLLSLEPNQRSIAGIYLASQYPVSVPGVSITSYLRLIFNIRQKKKKNVLEFKELLKQKASLINYPQHLLGRNLNEGFSGGEKKKTEILQMLLLEPRYVMLDEIDSGLDKNAVAEVFNALKIYKSTNKKTAFIIITHYDKVKEYLKPDFIHEIKNGILN